MPSKPFDPGYYTEHDLKQFGFKSIGSNVLIARNNTILGVENISIGDNVRIDGFCSIVANANGWLSIGSYVHIGSGCYLSAGEGISLADFSGLSQGVRIYTRTDDYSGNSMTNPTVPEQYTSITSGPVNVERHVVIGSGSVILPGITVGEGSSVGALSLVTKNLEPWGVYFGAPVKRLKDRSKKLLELEQELLSKPKSGVS